MNEVEFRNWLGKKGADKKIQCDCISRLKRIEREIENCDIDEQYRSDQCETLLLLLENNGNNEEMKKHPQANLPIGKYYMSTYRLALKKYIQFCDETVRR